MARIFIDGFETGNMGLWNSSSSMNITSSSPLDGDYSASSVNSGYAIFNLPATYKSLYFSMKIKMTASSNELVSFLHGSTVLVGVRTVNNVLHLTRGSSNIASATTGGLSTGTEYRLEFYAKIDNGTSGEAKILINGATIITWSSDTQPGADDDITAVMIGKFHVLGTFSGFIDNVVIDSTAFPGNTRIQKIVSDSTGNSTGWTPSASSNWECVDEVPATTADYVHTNTTGAIDLYGMTTINSSATSIKCIQVSVYGEVEGTPTPGKVQIALRHNGTNAFSSSLTPGAAGSPVWNTKLWDENPVTTVAWTPADIGSLEIGLKATNA